MDSPCVSLFLFLIPSKEKYFSITTSKHSIRVDPGEKWTLTPSNFGTSLPKMDSVPGSLPGKICSRPNQEPGQWVQILTTLKAIKLNNFLDFSDSVAHLLPASILIPSHTKAGSKTENSVGRKTNFSMEKFAKL